MVEKLPQSLTLNGEVCMEISLRQCITIRYHVKIHILGTANCSHITQEMSSQSCEINSFRSGFQTTLVLSGTSDAGIDSSWCKAADVVPDCCTALISDVEKRSNHGSVGYILGIVSGSSPFWELSLIDVYLMKTIQHTLVFHWCNN